MQKNKLNKLCIVSSQYSYFCENVLQKKFPGINFQIIHTRNLYKNIRYFLKKNFRKFEKALFFTYDLNLLRRPLLSTIILLYVSKKEAYFLDRNGQLEKITCFSLLFYYLPSFLKEIIYIPVLFFFTKWGLRNISDKKISRVCHKNYQNINLINPIQIPKGQKIIYLRTDHWFGLISGGSVGHIRGVAEGFLKLGHSLSFISTDKLESINEFDTPIYIIKVTGIFKNFAELPEIEYNFQLIRKARGILLKEKPTFIYQRYSLNNYAGAWLTKEFNIPFVLEYNGSFLWVSQHWGKKLNFKRLAEKIELTNLNAADLIVVVSKPLSDELIKRGISEKKILINPNGVNPDKFSPDLDGSPIRKKYNLNGNIVVGFIGTFGRWHGAEVLAEAILPVIKTDPNIHFLFIGDGPMMPAVKQIIQKNKVDKYVTFTDIIHQEDSPIYLSACDIFASPHVPNPDGTPFFGSPTKLFEYMALGKGIVASNLDQIGEVLNNEQNAILVTPGNVDELVKGILQMVGNEALRKRLGKKAREDVIANYTWEKNVKRVINRLKNYVW